MPHNAAVEERLWEAAWKGQLAVLLDIATPKPGNVHRYRDHPDVRLIHFAASAARLAHPLYQAALRGSQAQQQDPQNPKVGLGELIEQAVRATMAPHSKNTLLGTILLFIPLAAAAGLQAHSPRLTPTLLRQALTSLLQATTTEDALTLIRALQVARPGGSTPKTQAWTPTHQALDYRSPHTPQRIRSEGHTLRSLLALAAPYDAIAQEYATNFNYIFQQLHPRLVSALNRHPTTEQAILDTYMWELAQRPDTLIQRKAGPKAAEEVRRQASQLHQQMASTPPHQWHKLLETLDQHLRSKGSQLNPGTTADLLNAATYTALLVGDITTIL